MARIDCPKLCPSIEIVVAKNEVGLFEKATADQTRDITFHIKWYTPSFSVPQHISLLIARSGPPAEKFTESRHYLLRRPTYLF